MGLDGRLLPVVIGNPKIISQLDGCFLAGQLKQPGNKIHCIPISLTAKAVKTPVQFHAGIFVIVKRAAPLPELMDRKKRDIMERKGDKEDENKRQKQQKESSAAAL